MYDNFKELYKLKYEAELSFYKDAIEYYLKLYLMPFDTKKMHQKLKRIMKMYYETMELEKNTIELIRIKQSQLDEDYIINLLEDINDHYQTVYNYFEIHLLMFDNVIFYKDEGYFTTYPNDLDLSFYRDIQNQLIGDAYTLKNEI